MSKKRKWQFIKIHPENDSVLCKMQARFQEDLINKCFEKELLKNMEKILGKKLR